MLSTATALPPKSIGDVPIDKMGLAHYFENYERYLGPLRDQPLRFLELGIARGDSLKYWENWLPEAQITGIDINPCPVEFHSGRVRCYVGEQQDTALLDRIAAERATAGRAPPCRTSRGAWRPMARPADCRRERWTLVQRRSVGC